MTALASNPPFQPLDASLLGRPVHLLPAFAAQLRDDVAQALRAPASRRYWGSYQVGALAFARAGGAIDGARWTSFAADDGAIGFRLDRALLLRVLALRYGQGDADAAADIASVRVTATEERLALSLGRQLATVLATRIAINRGTAALDAPAHVHEGVAGVAPASGAWLLQLDICDGAGQPAGQAVFALDQGLMASVLRGLMPARPASAPAATAARPLAARLQVTLAGRLMRQEMLLASLFDLRVGDVIPVSLHRTDVLLDDSRLFTAAVTEHQGKLCLTAFEDAD